VLITGAWFVATHPWGYFLSPLFMLISVPLWRSLENLGGHEGAHGNWIRKMPRLNDRLANLLAAWWVMDSAESFRKRHNTHHRYFGEPPDPCFTRFSMFHFAQMKSWIKFFSALRHDYVPYLREYWEGYAGIKMDQLVKSAMLHAVIMLFGTWLWPRFWLGWLLVVSLPFFLILPVFRMLAESQEHNYDGSDELTDSHNNLSLFSRLYLHPVGDAYHKLHHLHPSIPHFRMRKVHLLLMKTAPEYRNSHETKRKELGNEPRLPNSAA
jgi:fatty acid desaturase